MSDFPTFSKNGVILPTTQATVSLMDIEYSYGYGVYETLKVRNNIVYFVDQHIERLNHSAVVIGIPLPFPPEKIKHFLTEYRESLQTPACNIKILVIGGKNPTLNIFASAPLFPDRKLYARGARLITYNYERLFPTAKTLNMLPSYLAYKKAKEQQCYDALLLDHNRIILEGTRTNFCLVKNHSILRAPRDRVLGGVTFLTLEHVAKDAEFTVTEDEISINDINKYDGAFITSTSTKIMPVATIDHFSFPKIPDTIKTLMYAYDAFLDTCNGVLR
jgi:branched-chain amino acid aminotransferase